MKKLLLASALLLLFSVSSSQAYVFGGSNLTFNEYPEMSDFDKPSSYSVPSEYELERYQEALLEYLENANNDIRRIQEAQDKAIEEYNEAVRRYNRGY